MSEEKKAEGGGLRFNTGKAELHQVPSSLSFAVAKTLAYGAQKYAKGNWRKGMSWTSVYDCANRHMLKWLDGEETDEESGLPHLYHAATNIAFLIEYNTTCPHLDDRFKGAIAHGSDSFDKISFNPYVKPEAKPVETLRKASDEKVETCATDCGCAIPEDQTKAISALMKNLKLGSN